MKLKLLRIFVGIGFNFKVDGDKLIATDGNGNELVEGTDYVLEEKDKPGIEQITQANGLTTYTPAK